MNSKTKYVIRYVDELGNPSTSGTMTKKTLADYVITTYKNKCTIINIKEL